MCWLFKRERSKPSVTLLTKTSEQVVTDLRPYNLKSMYPCLMDEGQPYNYVSAKEWADVLSYIYFDFPMPKYIGARMDCEDFAILLKGLVSALFGLNYFAFTVGMVPAGMHGFNFFQTEKGLVILEPQTGEFFDWNDPTKGYNPEWILL